jgi:hypothetical protein
MISPHLLVDKSPNFNSGSPVLVICTVELLPLIKSKEAFSVFGYPAKLLLIVKLPPI